MRVLCKIVWICLIYRTKIVFRASGYILIARGVCISPRLWGNGTTTYCTFIKQIFWRTGLKVVTVLEVTKHVQYCTSTVQWKIQKRLKQNHHQSNSQLSTITLVSYEGLLPHTVVRPGIEGDELPRSTRKFYAQHQFPVFRGSVTGTRFLSPILCVPWDKIHKKPEFEMWI